MHVLKKGKQGKTRRKRKRNIPIRKAGNSGQEIFLRKSSFINSNLFNVFKKMVKILILIMMVLFLVGGVSAADYYVDATNGNDANNGLSDATAWKTISKVNSFIFGVGDDVYFKCGGTWSVKDIILTIDWSGLNDDNRAVIGAYYMDAGSETVGVNGDGKPVFDGGWNTNQLFQTIIQLYGAHYITIQDLKLYNSYAFGILGTYDALSSHITLRRLHVDYTGRGGIQFYPSLGTGGIIEYCNIGRHNLRYGVDITTWDSGITYSANNGIIRYNEVHEGLGEGMALPGNNLLVEYNFVWAHRSVGLYFGCRTDDSIMRHNIVLGTTDTTYHQSSVYGGRTWNGAGIGINSETWCNDIIKRNKMYGNVVIGCSRGFQANKMIDPEIGYADRNYFYDNTLIDNYANFYVNPSVCNNVEFKNDLSIVHNDTITRTGDGNGHVYFKTIHLPDCYLPLGNFWAGSGSDDIGDWSHPNDVIGDPKLFKTSGWQNILKPSDIDIAQAFALTENSDAIDTAQNLGDEYAQGFSVGTNFNTPIMVQLANQNNYGNWDFGAYVYTGDVLSTCQSENYNCCDFCESGPQPLYDGDCPGVCCGVCTSISTCSPADTDTDGFVSINEVINYITGWKAGNVNINDLINGITEWKNGC